MDTFGRSGRRALRHVAVLAALLLAIVPHAATAHEAAALPAPAAGGALVLPAVPGSTVRLEDLMLSGGGAPSDPATDRPAGTADGTAHRTTGKPADRPFDADASATRLTPPLS